MRFSAAERKHETVGFHAAHNAVTKRAILPSKWACHVQLAPPLRSSARNSRAIPAAIDSRNQRRRAVGVPLDDRNLWKPLAVPASGVPTRDDRCIA